MIIFFTEPVFQFKILSKKLILKNSNWKMEGKL